jgi:hypothetical protein
VSGGAGHGCEPEVGPLPLVLIPNFRGGNLVAAPRALEYRLDDRPLLLQRMAGGQMEGDAEGAYVRGISRSS